MKTEVKRRIPYVILLLTVVIALILPCAAVLYQERSLIRYEKALMGNVHRLLPEHTGELAYILYQTEPEAGLIQEGEAAFASLAYMDQELTGKQRLVRQRGALLGAGLLGLCLAALPLVMYYFLKKLHAEEFHEQNQALCQLQEQAAEASALSLLNARLKDFTENIAHQIKTPLSRIMTSLELLREETQARRVQECIEHTDSIRELVNRLLAIGRLEAGEVIFTSEIFSLSILAEEILEETPGETRPQLILIPEDGEFLFSGSPEWIREALANLVDNAGKYGVSEKPPELTIEELPEEYRIRLRDYGPGFSEEELPQLFDRFYRTSRMEKGHVGLGLNLAKLIIEGHKGRISAGNHPEGGALFTILLPKLALMK